MTDLPQAFGRALVCVLLVGGVAVGSHAAQAAVTPGGTTPARAAARALGLTDKPLGATTTRVQPTTPGAATATVSTAEDIATVRITVSATGATRASGDATRRAATTPLSVPIRYSVPAGGSGTVVVRATGLDDAGRPVGTSTAVLHVRDSFGTAIASARGPLDLQLQHLSRAHERGALDDAAYAAAQNAATSGGATTSASRSRTAGRVGGTITTKGTVRWTDRNGGTHPVRGATVQIREVETAGSQLITSVTTADDGRYTASFVNDDGPGEGGRDIQVVVQARGAGFTVVPNTTAAPHRIQSSVTNDVADGTTLTVNLTANNSADNNTAFSVQDALITMSRYTRQVSGLSSLPNIPVVFPSGLGTFFDGATIQLLQLDRYDHDVVDHEYGHYVQHLLDIEDSPGGSHSLGENLAETRGKSAGLRLAWGEGWATYYAITAQAAENTAAQNIPNVGDLRYTDTEDASIDYSLESMAGGASLGEDNELADQRVMFDLADAGADPGDNRGVALGDQALFDVVTDAHASTLGQAYAALVVGKSAEQVVDYGCILTTHRVAPGITAPANGSQATSSRPTITWARNGLGPSFRNNRFRVRFYDGTYDQLLFTSNELTGTTFTPTQSQWNAILDDDDRRINVVVEGGNSATPVTGPYTSCNIRLVQPK